MVTLNRIYEEIPVENLTIQQIQSVMDLEKIHYSGDYGLEFKGSVKLIFSQN